MLRVFLFVLLLIGVGFVIQQTSEFNGEITAQFLGYEIKTSTQFVFILMFIASVFIFFLGQIWAFLVQAPQTFEKWRYTKRYEHGFEYFVEALEHLKSGEIKSAQKLGRKTQKLLPDARLKNFLAAELEIADEKPLKAIPHFEMLSRQKNASFMGLLGLIEQYTKLKDWDNVYKYAQQAYVQKSKNKKVVTAYLQSCFFKGEYEEILSHMNDFQKHSEYTSEFLDDVESFIYYEKAMAEENSKLKTKLFDKSIKAQETNILAVIALIQQSDDNVAKKLKLLNACFKKCPHPKIYELWLSTIRNEPNKYYKRRLKAFIKGNETSLEGLYVQAKEHLRLDAYEDALVFINKALKTYISNEMFQLKLLCLNGLKKHQEIKDLLEKDIPNNNYIFKGQHSINFYERWKNKAIFEADVVQSNINTKLLTHV